MDEFIFFFVADITQEVASSISKKIRQDHLYCLPIFSDFYWKYIKYTQKVSSLSSTIVNTYLIYINIYIKPTQYSVPSITLK